MDIQSPEQRLEEYETDKSILALIEEAQAQPGIAEAFQVAALLNGDEVADYGSIIAESGSSLLGVDTVTGG